MAFKQAQEETNSTSLVEPSIQALRSAALSSAGELRKLTSRINGQTGVATIHQPTSMNVRRISTGCFELDLAVGVNGDGTAGIPVGHGTILVGTQSSGKSLTAWRTAGQGQLLCSRCYRPAVDVQEVDIPADDPEEEATWALVGSCDCYAQKVIRHPLGPRPDPKAKGFAEWQALHEELLANSYRPFNVAVIDVEGTFDAAWVNRFAYARTMYRVIPPSAEQVTNIYTELINSGLVDMVIVDSLAAMSPDIEVQESADKSMMGVHARLLNRMFRVVGQCTNMASLRGRPVTSIWIQQWRDKIGIAFGDPRTMSGGKGQLFAAALIVDLSASKVERMEDPRWAGSGIRDADVAEIAYRIEVGVTVTKNKFAPANRKARYAQRLVDMDGWRAGEIEDFDNFFKLILKSSCAVMESLPGKLVLHLDGIGMEDVTFRNQDEAKVWLRADPSNRKLAERAFKVRFAGMDLVSTEAESRAAAKAAKKK
jgi:RecA/RadA recombinase